jgi:hypothetical protein
LAGNSAEFGDFLPVVRFWVENRTKIVPREGDLTAAQEGRPWDAGPANSTALGPVQGHDLACSFASAMDARIDGRLPGRRQVPFSNR